MPQQNATAKYTAGLSGWRKAWHAALRLHSQQQHCRKYRQQLKMNRQRWGRVQRNFSQASNFFSLRWQVKQLSVLDAED